MNFESCTRWPIKKSALNVAIQVHFFSASSIFKWKKLCRLVNVESTNYRLISTSGFSFQTLVDLHKNINMSRPVFIYIKTRFNLLDMWRLTKMWYRSLGVCLTSVGKEWFVIYLLNFWRRKKCAVCRKIGELFKDLSFHRRCA